MLKHVVINTGVSSNEFVARCPPAQLPVRITRCFHLFQRGPSEGILAGGHVHADVKAHLAALVPCSREAPRASRRRGVRLTDGKLHHCTFPGCNKMFCHATHARRHERNSHQFWRRCIRPEPLVQQHNVSELESNAFYVSDSEVVASTVVSDIGPSGMGSLYHSASGEWTPTMPTNDPKLVADSHMTGLTHDDETDVVGN